MEIIIDEAIKYLRALKRCETCEEGDISICKSCSCYLIGSSAKCYDAIDVAIENMRKYQKIEETYTKYLNDMVTNIYAEKKFVSALEEIFENGNDD